MSNAPWVSATAVRQGQMVLGTIWKQPGAKFKQRATGAIQYDVSYKCNTQDVPKFLPSPQSASQEYDNFWLDESESVEMTLGISTINLTYLGINQIPPPRYSLKCNKISEPIDTNPNFDTLVRAAGGFTQISTDPEQPAKAIVDGYGKFQGFGKDSDLAVLVGQSSFDDTAISYIARFVSSGRRSDLISKLETICTPMGSPPSFLNRNWKLSDIDENEVGEGAFYEYEITWELSSQGGWLDLVYSAAARNISYPVGAYNYGE